MNAFNRLAMVLILLGTAGAIAIGILLLLLAPAAIGAILTNTGRTLSAGGADSRLGQAQLELTVIGLVLFVPIMVLLWLEVRRTARDSVRLTKVGAADARLSMQAVSQSIAYFVDALPGVVRIRPRLSADDKGVAVRLDVETHPEVDVRTKTDEIAKTVKNVVEDRLGLTLKSLQIQIHHAAYPRAAAARPASIEAPKTAVVASAEKLQPAGASPAVPNKEPQETSVQRQSI